MQKKNIKPIIKKSLGLLLAAGLTISLIPSSLSAENPYWYSMYITSGTDEKNFNENINSNASGFWLKAGGDGEGTINLTGNLTTVENGAEIYAEDTGIATLDITGDMDASNNGVQLSSSNSGEANFYQNGNIAANLVGIRAEANDASAIDISTSNIETYDNCIEVEANGAEPSETDEGPEIYVKAGNLKSQSGSGVQAIAKTKGFISVTTGNLVFEPNVEATKAPAPNKGDLRYKISAGLELSSKDSSTLTVTSKDIINPENGVILEAENESNAFVMVGDITNATYNGIELKTSNNGQKRNYAGVSAEDITSDGCGVYFNNYNSLAYVTANNITSDDYYAVDADNSGTGVIYVNGDITTTGYDAVSLDNSGQLGLINYGSVFAGEGKGIIYRHSRDSLVSLTGAGQGFNNLGGNEEKYQGIILVADRLMGEYGIDISGCDKESYPRMGVWKIDTTEQNVYGDTDDKDFEKSIEYIIRLEQPEKGGTVTATYANGDPLRSFLNNGNNNQLSSNSLSAYDDILDKTAAPEPEVKDYEVAHEGEKVVLHVDLDKGYKLVGAYNGTEEKTPLKKDKDGNYYIEVPNGGGVDLSVDIQKENTYTVTFNANGHGKAPAAQKVTEGQKAKKPSDPKATGWKFGGWYTDKKCTKAYNFNTPVNKNITLYAKWTAEQVKTVDMLRLYNPNSGEHFYTASVTEKDNLVKAGWKYEGLAWKAPAKSKTPVYRLYNPNAGDHHYTISAKEKENLVKAGWKDEGIGWYSDDAKTSPVYRAYNPNAITGSHHFTRSKAEIDNLVKAGWKDEGIAFYCCK